jgi:hypothetical protein
MEGRLQAVGRHVDDLAGALSEFPSSRQRSLALTKLEECLMWAERADDEGGSRLEAGTTPTTLRPSPT